MKKFTIYISGPITGNKDYMSQFLAAEENVKKKGYAVINPAKVNAMLPEATEYEDYMAISLKMLERSDAIYMLDGWECSTGANREYGFALASDKVIFEQSGGTLERLFDCEG